MLYGNKKETNQIQKEVAATTGESYSSEARNIKERKINMEKSAGISKPLDMFLCDCSKRSRN